MDLTTVFGILIGVGGILAGNALDDGHLSSLLHFTAGLIVFGGTLGATIVSNTKKDLLNALGYLKMAFSSDDDRRLNRISKEIIDCSRLARKESLLAVEKKIKAFTSDYMKNVFRFMVDGVDPERIEDIFEQEIILDEQRKNQAAKVWDDAGGYAPTIGIIGAVLGLIHVMGNLTNTSQLGKGIAVAFVATIYGIASANLFFIPIATKIKNKIQREVLEKEMIVEGALSILTGQNPYIIEEKMRNFTAGKKVKSK